MKTRSLFASLNWMSYWCCHIQVRGSWWLFVILLFDWPAWATRKNPVFASLLAYTRGREWHTGSIVGNEDTHNQPAFSGPGHPTTSGRAGGSPALSNKSQNLHLSTLMGSLGYLYTVSLLLWRLVALWTRRGTRGKEERTTQRSCIGSPFSTKAKRLEAVHRLRRWCEATVTEQNRMSTPPPNLFGCLSTLSTDPAVGVCVHVIVKSCPRNSSLQLCSG